MDQPLRLLASPQDSRDSPSKTEESQSTSETELNRLAEQRKLNELKSRLKDFLRRHPRNFTEAGRSVGLPRATVVRIIQENQEEFDELEEERLDALEEQAILAAQGQAWSENFSFAEALKVLERLRPERWSNAVKKKSTQKKATALSKEVLAMLKDG